MLVYKCDICKKTIPKRVERFSITKEGEQYDSYLLCKKCGKPIAGFLKKKGLKERPIKGLPF